VHSVGSYCTEFIHCFIFLRVPENRVLRKVFGRKKDEVTGEWKRLRNAEICDLWLSPNIRMIK